MAAIFDGSNYLARFSGDVCPQADYTVILWLKRDTIISGDRSVLSIGNTASTASYTSLRFRSGTSNRLLTYVVGGGQSKLSHASVPPLGFWVPVIVRRTGHTVRTSVAGYSPASVDWETALTGSPDYTADVLCLGSQIRTSEDSSVRFTGAIAEVMLFNESFAEADYLRCLADGFPSIGQVPAGVDTSSLLAHYPLDSDNGPNDVSGNDRHLTNTGGVAFDDAADLYATDQPEATMADPVIKRTLASTAGEIFEVKSIAGRQLNVSTVWQLSDPPSLIKVRAYGYFLGLQSLSADLLSNKESDFASLPHIGNATIGRQVITIEATGGSGCHGCEVNVGSDFAGTVESRGSATHCRPLETVHDGQAFRVHTDTAYNVYLSRDGSPLVWDAPLIPTTRSSNDNEQYHCGASVVSVPGQGLVVFQAYHQNASPRFMAVPNADIDNLPTAKPVVHTLSTRATTYCHNCVTSDGTVWSLQRAADGMAILFRIADAFSSPVVTEIHLGQLYYPRLCRVCRTKSGREMLVIGHHNRPASSYGFSATAFVLDPDTISAFSFNGHPSAGVGSEADPMWSTAQRDQDTHGGEGIQVVPVESLQQKYVPDAMLADLSDLDDITMTGGKIMTPVIKRNSAAIADAKTDYGRGEWELYRHFGNRFDRVSLPGWFRATNSHRESIGLAFQDQAQSDQGGSVVVGLKTDRGSRTANGKYDEQPFAVYYDWGAMSLQAFVIRDAWGASPQFKLTDDIPTKGGFPAAFIVATDHAPNRFTFQSTSNDAISEHHRQMVVGQHTVATQDDSPASVKDDLPLVRGDHYDGTHGPRLNWQSDRSYANRAAKLIVFDGATVLGEADGTADGNTVTIDDYAADFDASIFKGNPRTAKLSYAVVVYDTEGEFTERFGRAIVSFRADLPA